MSQLSTLGMKRAKFGYAEATCHNKQQDTAFCRRNYECLSNHCHWKRCKGIAFKNIERDASCHKSDDCNHEQRCEKQRCVNKKKIGSPLTRTALAITAIISNACIEYLKVELELNKSEQVNEFLCSNLVTVFIQENIELKNHCDLF